MILPKTVESKAKIRFQDCDPFSHLKAIIWCGFTHYNLITKKRDKHSEDLMSLFKTIHNPMQEKLFEERIISIRK